MPERTLIERVEVLEQNVDELQILPARVAAVETQILQLRDEMRDGFSAILNRLERGDQQFVAIDQRFDAVDQRFDAVDQRFDAVDRRFDAVDRRFDAVDRRFEDLERQIREGDDETRRYMRVLHEEVLARLALLQEGRGRRRP